MRYSLVVLLLPVLAQAQEAVRLTDRFAVGSRHTVRTRVELSGELTPPPGKGKAVHAESRQRSSRAW